MFVGIVVEPFTHWFSDFLGTHAVARTGATASRTRSTVEHHFNWALAGMSTVLALGGIGLAFMLYRNGGPEKVPRGLAVFALSRNKLYVDEVYHAVLVKPAEVLAFLARVFDGFLDALARLIAAVPRFVGALGPADPERAGAVLRPVDGAGAGRVPVVRRVPHHPVGRPASRSSGESESTVLDWTRLTLDRDDVTYAVIRVLVLLLVLLPLVGGGGRAAVRPRRAPASRCSLALVHLGLTAAVVAIGDPDLDVPRPSTSRGTAATRHPQQFHPEFVPGDPGGARQADGADAPHRVDAVQPRRQPDDAGTPGPNVQFFLGIDGLNIWLVALASVMLIPAILVSWESVKEKPGGVLRLAVPAPGRASIGAFLSFDVILFYIFFELTLIPAFFLIGRWGIGSGRRDAARKFFLYTLAGSLLTLVGVIGVVLTNPQPTTGSITFSLPELMGNVQQGLRSAHQKALAGDAGGAGGEARRRSSGCSSR